MMLYSIYRRWRTAYNTPRTRPVRPRAADAVLITSPPRDAHDIAYSRKHQYRTFMNKQFERFTSRHIDIFISPQGQAQTQLIL